MCRIPDILLRRSHMIRTLPSMWMGNQAVPKKVNTAFLGFSIESGEHSVVIIYHASGVAAGKFLSLVGLVMMAVIFLIEKRQTKRGTY